MSVLAAIAVLAILIIVHELGHFLAARLQGIHVNRFSIGFGPILWKYQGPETEYAIRGIPLGGFVGFPDDEEDCPIPPNDPNLMRNRPLLDRAIVISAGVIANLIFAYFVLVAQFGIAGMPEASQPGILIPQLASDVSNVAAQAGIKAGDVILEANGQKFDRSLTQIETLKQLIENSPGKTIQFTIQRGEQINTLNVTPAIGTDGHGRLGIALAHNGNLVRRRPDNILQAFTKGAQEFERMFTLTLQGFGQLITRFTETAPQVGGPIKIVEKGAEIANADPVSLLAFAAFISINLAFINILPLPALDGGQLAFLIIEGLRGKPLPTHIQDGVMQTGLLLILGLGIFLIVRDTAQLEGVQKLLQ